MTQKDLKEQAKKVLNANFNEDKGFTIPCEGLYPFQWNWDSGFIAIGYAHYDVNKAKPIYKNFRFRSYSKLQIYKCTLCICNANLSKS